MESMSIWICLYAEIPFTQNAFASVLKRIVIHEYIRLTDWNALNM